MRTAGTRRGTVCTTMPGSPLEGIVKVAAWPTGTWLARPRSVPCAEPGVLVELDEGALVDILTKPKNALVKQYQRLFEMENIELTFADEALGAVARRAIERKTGARGLRSILESILLETMFDLPGLEGVEEVVISREVVEGTARPLYIYADRSDRAVESSASA